MSGIEEFSRLPVDEARDALLACCSSPRWADAVTAGRPYDSLEALLAQSDAAVAGLGEADLLDALAGHPRLGDRQVTGRSAVEQASVTSAGAAVLDELAAGNAAYEQRFGHVYLACATGRSAAELLSFLAERLGNDRAEEWRVVASELAKINRIRLRALVEAPE